MNHKSENTPRPPDAVDCLACNVEGIVMTCDDIRCIADHECTHGNYELCDNCEGRTWFVP